LAKLLIHRWLYCLTGVFALTLASCTGDGHFTILGYTTQPNYNLEIRTVYVPIFQNVTFARGLEFDLTRAVIREIESKTPFKVVDCREGADTELIGKIINTSKGVITLNQLGEVRDAQAGLSVELTWRDLRPGCTGTILSADPKKEEVRGENPLPGPKSPPPALVTPSATYIPEVGGSVLAARKQLVDRAAIQIVSMMEKGW
jgi:Lipopolysaccharide-assembly